MLQACNTVGGRSLVNEVNHGNMVVSLECCACLFLYYMIFISMYLCHSLIRCWKIAYHGTKKFIHVVCSLFVIEDSRYTQIECIKLTKN